MPQSAGHVLDRAHKALKPGDGDDYTVYEKLFFDASGEAQGSNAKQLSLSRKWDKYASVIVPRDERDCANTECLSLPMPPKGKFVTVLARGTPSWAARGNRRPTE